MDGGVPYHGTCMAALAAGTVSGTSKDATIIPIKAFHKNDDATSFASWAAVFNVIVENIVLTSKIGNAVITMSFGGFCFGVPS
jgi:hypothetical protein